MTGDAKAPALLTEGRPAALSARPMTGLEQAATSMDLDALVPGGAEGRRGCLLRLAPTSRPKVFDYLFVLTGDRTAAEDLVQQTCPDACQRSSSPSQEREHAGGNPTLLADDRVGVGEHGSRRRALSTRCPVNASTQQISFAVAMRHCPIAPFASNAHVALNEPLRRVRPTRTDVRLAGGYDNA
jgi:hypothetical protein